MNFGEWLDYELIYLYVMFLPESGALCGLICWCIALEDALSEMLDDKVPAQKFLFFSSPDISMLILLFISVLFSYYIQADIL